MVNRCRPNLQKTSYKSGAIEAIVLLKYSPTVDAKQYLSATMPPLLQAKARSVLFCGVAA